MFVAVYSVYVNERHFGVLFRFFGNLLCCIDFRFALQVVGLLVEHVQKSTGNRVNSPCDVTGMQGLKQEDQLSPRDRAMRRVN